MPALQQAFFSEGNPPGQGDSGVTTSNYKFTPHHPIGASNCLIIILAWSNVGTTPTISDTQSNAWSSAAVTAVGGTGNWNLGAWVLPGATAGATTFTIATGSATQTVKFAFLEYSGLATSSVVNGTQNAGNISIVSHTLSVGSFTPGANSGGNLLIASFYPDSGVGSNASSWTAGTNFALLDGDIAWTDNQGIPSANEFYLQNPPASINPSITIGTDTADTFNAIAIALKVSSGAGTDNSANPLRLVKRIQQYDTVSASTWTLQFPTTGNLRVVACTQNASSAGGNGKITSVTDSESNTWTNATIGTDAPQVFYLKNAAANAALTITVHFQANPAQNQDLGMFDIANASATQPGNSAAGTLVSTGGATSIQHQPDLTPSVSNSMILAFLQNGQGPSFTPTSPTGAVGQQVDYTGKTDSSFFDSGDGWASLSNTSTSAQNWTWNITSHTTSVAGMAIEFLAPPAVTVTGGTLPLMGVG